MEQYIVFRVTNQYFTIPILITNRIIALENVTHIPDTVDYIMGIIESESEVLPVIDLSKRFFDRSLEDRESAQVLIVYWKDKKIGLVVDEVLTIRTYDSSQIDYQLDKITTLNQDKKNTPIKSFIRTDEGLILELDIENLFELNSTVQIQALFDFNKEEQQEDIKD